MTNPDNNDNDHRPPKRADRPPRKETRPHDDRPPRDDRNRGRGDRADARPPRDRNNRGDNRDRGNHNDDRNNRGDNRDRGNRNDDRGNRTEQYRYNKAGQPRNPVERWQSANPRGNRPPAKRFTSDDRPPRRHHTDSDRPPRHRQDDDRPRRPHSDRPRDDRPHHGNPRSDYHPRRDYQRNDDRPRPYRPRDDRPHHGNPRSDYHPRRDYQRNDDRPRPYRPRDDRPHHGKPRSDDRPRRDYQRNDRPRDDRPPHRHHSDSDRPYNNRNRDDRPPRDYQRNDRPRDDRPPRRHHSDSDRPHNNRPRDDRPPRPRTDKPYTPPPGEKVQKILADSGLGSRRQMESLLLEGRVQLNGKPAILGMRALEKDAITIDGKPVRRGIKQRRILLYNKPVGKIVSRDAEPGADTVFTDLPPVRGGRWMNIGRLDVNSEGLLLFSTDGDWVHEMAHPRSDIEREYRVRASGALLPETLETAKQDGVDIGDIRPVLLRQFTLEREGEGVNCWYRITLSEGRNRAVRRIFEQYGLQVSRLIRIRFGDHHLPPTLPPGAHQELPQEQ